ncbi:hypothetical protein [Micromonospora sp. DT62]|uniref:hypothetical protein n=1 Tax=Micromonospora sp. DT62 TaxID=3416521 RepID=UPI003CECCC77
MKQEFEHLPEGHGDFELNALWMFQFIDSEWDKIAEFETTYEQPRTPPSRSSANPPTSGFAVHPRRWVVERTLASLTACRRLARDYDRHPEVSEAIVRWAAIASMTRRIIRGQPARRQLRRTFT